MKVIFLLLALFGFSNGLYCQETDFNIPLFNFGEQKKNNQPFDFHKNFNLVLTGKFSFYLDNDTIVNDFDNEYSSDLMCGLNYDFGNKHYSYHNISELIDSCMIYIFRNKLPQQGAQDFKVFYDSDVHFKSIIDKINKLPQETDSVKNKEAEYIKKEIYLINHPVKKIYALLHYGGHFLKRFDSEDVSNVFYNNAVSIANNTNSPLLRADCFMALGDYFTRWESLPGGINWYFDAAAIYDSLNMNKATGLLLNKIGDLFDSRYLKTYKHKAAEYYLLSSTSYFANEDSINTMHALVSFLKMGESMMDMALLSDNKESKDNILKDIKNIIAVVFELQKMSSNKGMSQLYSNDFSGKFHKLCGGYFESRHDSASLITAKYFYESAFMLIVNDFRNYKLQDLYQIIFSLTRIHSKLRNEQAAYKYLNLMFELAKKEKNSLRTHFLYIKKAYVDYMFGKYDEGIKYAKMGIDSSYINDLYEVDKNLLLENAYSELSWLYSAVNKHDSSNTFTQEYNEIISTHLDDLLELNSEEAMFNSILLVKNSERVKKKYDDQTNLLKFQLCKLDVTRGELELMNNDLGVQLSDRDRVNNKLQLNILKKENELARKSWELSKIKGEIIAAERLKYLAKYSSYIAWIIGGLATLVLLGLMLLSYRKNKYFNGQLTQKQQTILKNEKENYELKTLAIANTLNPHSLKNITLGLPTEPFQLSASDMSEQLFKFNKFFQLLYLYSKEDLNYCLGMEIVFIENYVEFQRVNLRHLKIEFEMPENVGDFGRLKFPSLILFNCIENCYENAFRPKDGNKIKMDIKLEGKFILISISDNGKGLDDDDNIVKGGGLNTIESKLSLFNRDKPEIHQIKYGISTVWLDGKKSGVNVIFKIPAEYV